MSYEIYEEFKNIQKDFFCFTYKEIEEHYKGKYTLREIEAIMVFKNFKQEVGVLADKYNIREEPMRKLNVFKKLIYKTDPFLTSDEIDDKIILPIIVDVGKRKLSVRKACDYIENAKQDYIKKESSECSI